MLDVPYGGNGKKLLKLVYDNFWISDSKIFFYLTSGSSASL